MCEKKNRDMENDECEKGKIKGKENVTYKEKDKRNGLMIWKIQKKKKKREQKRQ